MISRSQPGPCANTVQAPARSSARVPLRVTAAVATRAARPRQRSPERVVVQGPTNDDGATAAAGQRSGTQLLPWFNRPAQSPSAPVTLEEATSTSKQPILSFAGGGIFFW